MECRTWLESSGWVQKRMRGVDKVELTEKRHTGMRRVNVLHETKIFVLNL